MADEMEWYFCVGKTFYQKPKTIGDLVNITVGRILASLNVDSDLYHEWNGNN